MRNHLKALLIVGLTATAGVMTSAQAAGDFKIGYVDAARLIKEAPQAQAASRKLETEFEPRKQKLDAQRIKIKNLETQLQKDALVMKESDRSKKEKELVEMQRNWKRDRQEVQEDYNLRRNEEINKLEKDVYKAIVEHGEANKYNLIVRSDLILYAPKSSDITDAILKKLGKK